ncbi:MAG: YfhO family protein [Acidobacteriota bacterium]
MTDVTAIALEEASAPAAAPPATTQILPVPRRHDILALLVLALVSTAFFADVLAGFSQFYMRDLTRYYYPAKQILREIVYHGEFPYWNRYFSAGQPIAANPEHEVFYPLTWLILMPSYDFGYRLHILIHVYIGLFGMYALLRSMRLRPYASFYGALVFGLGGLYLSYINLLPILFCAAWLPLTCLYVRRFLLDRNLRDFACAALFLGIQFLVGEPTTVMQTGFLIGMYALYRAWYLRPRISKAVVGIMWIALISVCGLLVGAAQILPAIDHVRDSARARAFEFDLVSAWSMPFAKIAELIYPNVLGHISIDQVMWYWGGGLYPGMGSPFLFSIYAGLITMALAVGGAFVRPRGGRFVLILVAFSTILALGGHTPLMSWLYKAGIATSIRYPEKFILIAIFALTIFAAQMLDRLLAGDDGVRDGALGFVAATSCAAAVLAILAFTPIYSRTFMKMWSLSAGPAAVRMVTLSRNDWIVAAVRGLILLALLVTVRTRRRTVWHALFAIVVIADLGLVTWELNPRMPRRFFDPPPVNNTMRSNRADFRLFHEADWYGQEEIARQFFSTGNAVYWVVRNGLFPMTPAGSHLRTVLERDYDKTALLPTIDLVDSVWDVKRNGRKDWAEPFMAMSNAWYRGVYADFKEEQKRTGGDFKKSQPIRFLEAFHYPRYYFADQIVTIRSRQDFVTRLTQNSYSPSVAFVGQPGFVPGKGTVRSARETANSVTLEVDSEGQTFLVMSVTPHKYWRIAIDGKSVPAVVTNIGYQGIVVTPGHHTVTMQYRNELVLIGLTLSGLAAATFLLILIFYRRRIRFAPLPAYEERLHVIADAEGMHVEPVVGE